MKLVKVGKSKLIYIKKDNTKSSCKASPQVIGFAKKALKVGQEFGAEFKAGKIVKVTPYKGRANTGNNGNSVASDERSVLNAICTLLSGVKGITTENVEETLKETFKVGLELVKGTAVKNTDDEDDEEDTDDEDDEEDTDDEDDEEDDDEEDNEE